MIIRLSCFVSALSAVLVSTSESPLGSSRFERLSGATSRRNRPVVIKLRPNAPLTPQDYERAKAEQIVDRGPRLNPLPRPRLRETAASNFRNEPTIRRFSPPSASGVPRLPHAQTVGPPIARVPPGQAGVGVIPGAGVPPPPPLPQPAAQGGGIPPQLARILGLQNLGIPGLVAPQPPITTHNLPGGLDPSQLAQFAAQNPALAQTFLESGGFRTGAPSPFGPLPGTASSIPTFPGAQPGPQQASPNAPPGLLGMLTRIGSQLAQNSGIGDILSRGGPNPATDPAGAFSSLLGAAQVGGIPGRAPPSVGLPRLPGLPLLPGGIPKDTSGQIDVVKLMSQVTRRVTNGTTLSDVLPPNQLQTFADNLTNVLLPETPDLDLTKFMGRWFEGINSPRASEQRCVVHHYGGLTDNQKTATFTALKIYREFNEFGQVRYSIGYAFRGGHNNGMLQMHSSETPDPTPYWVYKLGPESDDHFGNPQYEWAVVSNWVKYPVTVLVRDPDKFRKEYQEEVLRYLEDQGFINGFIRAFNMLQPVSYTNCQYSESTFQVFG